MPLGLHRYYSELQLSLFLAISACHCASSACGVKDETPRCNQRGSHPSRKTREGWGTRFAFSANEKLGHPPMAMI
jgi:hypothetical protein